MPRRVTFSPRIDPAAWRAGGPRPGRPARRGAARAAGRAGRRPAVPAPARRRRRRAGATTCPGRAGTSASPELPDRRRPAVAYFSPEFGIDRGAAAVLRRARHPGRRPPQGQQRPGRAADRRRPAVPARVLHPVAVRGRLAGRALPGRRPERPAADPAAGWPRRHRRAGPDHRGPGRAAPCSPPRSGWPRWAGCRCCCSTPTSRRTSRPCARSPTGCTAAAASTGCARNCCSASAASGRCGAFCELTGQPQPEVFHTNEGHAGFLGLERIRELTMAGLSFAEALERLPGGHRVHHPHAGAGRHRPVRPGADRAAVRRVQRGPGAAVDQVLALGAETYPGGDPDRVQHGRDGHAAGPAGERRQQAARPGQPGDVRRAVAGLRHRPRCRSARSPTGCTLRPGWPRRSSTWPPRARGRGRDGAAAGRAARTAARGRPGLGPRSPRPGRPRSARSAGSCGPGWWPRPGAGCAPPGGSAAPPTPSWPGSTRRSTRTC